MSTVGRGIRTYQGSVSIITGGASGIGRGIGAELSKRSAGEIVIADLQPRGELQVLQGLRRGLLVRKIPLIVSVSRSHLLRPETLLRSSHRARVGKVF